MKLEHAEDWENAYRDGESPPWNMGAPTPVLAELLDECERLGLRVGPRVAVPGCGLGHDAAWLAERGFEVTGADFAPSAIEGARARYADAPVRWVQADWFRSDLEPFDAVVDHTFFVAMPPERRAELIQAHAERLRPGGLWLGIFFTAVPKPEGPPFAIQPDELRRLARPAFEVIELRAATRSHPARAGREILLVARRS